MPRDPTRSCFACGEDNPIGLHLRFSYGDGSAEACFVPQPAHQGFPGLLHGGLVATLLDEAMAHAVIASVGPAVTGEIRVRLRGRGVRLGEPVRVRGWIVERRGRLVQAEAEVVGADHTVLAQAEGKFMRVSTLEGAPSLAVAGASAAEQAHDQVEQEREQEAQQ
ncbi:MAG: PaaI family thioesterase [Chloroflexia bacterium]